LRILGPEHGSGFYISNVDVKEYAEFKEAFEY